MDLDTFLSEDETRNSFDISEESIYSAFEEDNDDNDQLTSSNDDKSFYRDFTMKFDCHNLNKQKDPELQKFNIFQREENFLASNNKPKHVNLTCFISSIEFHISLLNTIQKICLYINSLNDEHQLIKNRSLFELMKLFSITYISSLELERNISFKILISKIFYLNYDVKLANFISLTKIAFISINYLYFEFFIEKFINFSSCSEINPNTDILSFNSLDPEISFNEIQNKIRSFNRFQLNPDEHFSSVHQFFVNFIKHLCLYYINLNEQSHDFKLDKALLKNFFQNFKTENENVVDLNKPIESKVTSLFRFYEQHNKAFTMLNLSKSSNQYSTTQENEVILEENVSSDSKYLKKDSRFRYQIWSNEMINFFVLNLKEKIFTNEKNSNLRLSLDGTDSENLIKFLVQLVIVYNSCSSYCQCLTYENNYSKADFIKTREISASILSSIFKIFKFEN